MSLTPTPALPTKFLDPGRRTTESEVLLHSLTKPLLRPSAARGDNRVATTDLDSLFHWTELPDGAAWWILDDYMHTSHVCQNHQERRNCREQVPHLDRLITLVATEMIHKISLAILCIKYHK